METLCSTTWTRFKTTVKKSLPKNYKPTCSLGQFFQNECEACYSSKITCIPTNNILIFVLLTLIFQIFSNSVSVGLKYYRENIKVLDFKYTQETEKFSKIFNDIFDSLNKKFPAEGIRKNSKDFKVCNKKLWK